MSVDSLAFLGLIVAGLTIWSAMRTGSQRLACWLALSAVFVVAQAWSQPIALWPLVVFLILGWLSLQAVHRTALPLSAAVVVLVVAFAYLKRYVFLRALPFPAMAVSTVGLSYVFFRVIHVVVDVRQGALARPPSGAEFLGYTCSWLTFLSGPIQRFGDFQQSLYVGRAVSGDGARQAVSRLTTGLFKVILIAPVFRVIHAQRLAELLNSPAGPAKAIAFAVALGVYLIFLYFNFSGYMDIVISAGRLFGVDIPENFDRPWTSDSLIDIWQHWHITLSEWFRDYVFGPLTKALTYRWPNPRFGSTIGAIGFFLTFLLMGLWHGTTLTFLAYGVILGGGASLARMYQVGLRRRLGKNRLRALQLSAWYEVLARSLTLTYFACALVCVWSPVGLTELFHRTGATGAGAGVGLLAVVLMAAEAVLIAVERAGVTRKVVAASAWSSPMVQRVWVAAKIFALCILAVDHASGGVFVYQEF